MVPDRTRTATASAPHPHRDRIYSTPAPRPLRTRTREPDHVITRRQTVDRERGARHGRAPRGEAGGYLHPDSRLPCGELGKGHRHPAGQIYESRLYSASFQDDDSPSCCSAGRRMHSVPYCRRRCLGRFRPSSHTRGAAVVVRSRCGCGPAPRQQTRARRPAARSRFLIDIFSLGWPTAGRPPQGVKKVGSRAPGRSPGCGASRCHPDRRRWRHLRGGGA